MRCISIAKFEGKDTDSKIIGHINNAQAFSTRSHLSHRLRAFMHDGFQIGERTLSVRLFECHDLACTYNIVPHEEMLVHWIPVSVRGV